jgi:hypothetical protein
MPVKVDVDEVKNKIVKLQVKMARGIKLSDESERLCADNIKLWCECFLELFVSNRHSLEACLREGHSFHEFISQDNIFSDNRSLLSNFLKQVNKHYLLGCLDDDTSICLDLKGLDLSVDLTGCGENILHRACRFGYDEMVSAIIAHQKNRIIDMMRVSVLATNISDNSIDGFSIAVDLLADEVGTPFYFAIKYCNIHTIISLIRNLGVDYKKFYSEGELSEEKNKMMDAAMTRLMEQLFEKIEKGSVLTAQEKSLSVYYKGNLLTILYRKYADNIEFLEKAVDQSHVLGMILSQHRGITFFLKRDTATITDIKKRIRQLQHESTLGLPPLQAP